MAGELFTAAIARAFDRAQLKSEATYPDATITAKELEIRARFEDIIGVRLYPASITEYYDGDGTDTLYLNEHNPNAERPARPVTLTSITVIATDGTETAYTAPELAAVVKYPYKLVRRSGAFTKGLQNIKVVYTVGYAVAPADIKGAALQAVVLTQPDGLVPNLADSAASEGEENGIRWSRVKDDARGRWFGHEGVDSILRRHRAIETPMGIA